MRFGFAATRAATVTGLTLCAMLLGAGETPARGYFPRAGVEKAFVALNILVGFSLAAEHSAVGE